VLVESEVGRGSCFSVLLRNEAIQPTDEATHEPTRSAA